MKKKILFFSVLNLVLLVVFSNEISIEKFYSGNLTTGSNLEIGYIIENKIDQDIVIKIRDRNIINDAGFNVDCLQLTIPKNQKVKYVYDQKLFLNKAGNFTLEPALAEYTFNGKNKEVRSNSINLEISGKEYNTKYITNIYRCDGISRQSTQYSQIGSNSIVISNGNIMINQDDFFNIDDDFDKMFQEMEERMNQVRKQMYQQIQQINQPQNYQQYVPNYVPDYDDIQNSINQNNVNNQQAQQTLNQTSNSIKNNNQQINQSSVQKTTSNSSNINNKMNQKENVKNNKNNFRNLLLWIILSLIALLIIIYLVLNKSKKQSTEIVEEIKEKSIYQYFKLIKKEFETIDEKKKDKKKYLKFKDLVAEFKDKIETKVSDEIIENINLFLYADNKENLKSALDDLEKIVKKL
ncbi:MAG: hypothetical protein QW210_03540 [Candidatus Woesearchaeota archaeon]